MHLLLHKETRTICSGFLVGKLFYPILLFQQFLFKWKVGEVLYSI